MTAIDLFAGLGGFSEGAKMAGIKTVWAADHWPLACQWFAGNHSVTPTCQDVQQADWRQVPSHDLLLASPACQGHSIARGKERPEHDAMRSTAWAVVSAAEYHRPKVVVVENVKEFLKWNLYPSWADALSRLGYSISPHVLDAADHGVPQHRVRVFIVCTRSRNPVTLQLQKRDHIPARSFIDFNAGKWSRIYQPGRSKATLNRIANGRKTHGDQFVAPYFSSGSGLTGRSIDRPIGTVTTRDRWAVINGDRMRMMTTDEYRQAMGFGATFKLPSIRRDAIHLLGNAVCPPEAAELLKCLQEVM